MRGDDGSMEELGDVTKRVAGKLENACSEVLKTDLQDAEKWISEQQNGIQEQIEATNKAEENIRTALTAAGTFSLT